MIIIFLGIVWIIPLMGWHIDIFVWFALPIYVGELLYWPLVIQFTIISLAILETCRGALGKRFSILGDISYSCYLIHYPLQIVSTGVIAFLVSRHYAVDYSIFYSPWMLFGFFAALIPISYATYRYFERPLQRFLRARLLRVDNGSSPTGSKRAQPMREIGAPF